MPVPIPANRADPSGTKTLRENYRRHLQRPLNQLITDVRTGIIDEDVFGLKVSTDTLADDLPPLVRHDRRETKEDRFNQWLQTRLQEGVLEQISRNGNTFIRSAYARGLKDGTRMVRAVGGDAPAVDIEAAFNTGVHRRSLSRLYREDYTDLEDITQELSRQINDELATGLAQGENPRKVARRITDRIDKVGKTRAETLARTRVIAAHSEATLNRYEEIGVGTVRHGEWADADDDRVCPICKRLDGRDIPLGEARTGTFEITEDDLDDDEPASLAGVYPLRPPAHPRGRCVLLPKLT